MTTLAELGEIAKADSAADRRDRRDSATTSALRGGGAVLAGAGLIGGGIPGAKPNPAHIKHWKEPGNRASASRASIGGIFGYRDAAHTKFSGESAAREAGYRAQTPDEHLSDADLYNRHRSLGKINAEKKIIGHMKNGRLVSYGALAAGTGMLAAAAKRKRDSATTRTFNYHRQPVTMQRQPDGSWKQSTALPAARSPYRTEKENVSDAARYSGAALGTGLAGAGVSHAGKRVMESQSRKWLDRDVKLNQEVNRLVPSLKTKAGDFSGGTRESIARAGLKQGEATQARYFRGVYDKHARLLGRTRKGSLIAAGAGAAGLLATKKYADRNRKRR